MAEESFRTADPPVPAERPPGGSMVCATCGAESECDDCDYEQYKWDHRDDPPKPPQPPRVRTSWDKVLDSDFTLYALIWGILIGPALIGWTGIAYHAWRHFHG